MSHTKPDPVATFERSRPHLRTIAFRIMRTDADAEDIVQDAWFRYNHADTSNVHNISAWLTRVVVRLCLDSLRRNRTVAPAPTETFADPRSQDTNPEEVALLASDLTDAFVIILEALTPPQRVAFVLHDSFGMSFTDIANTLDTTVGSAKKLASRARARLRSRPTVPATSVEEAERVVSVFLDAAQRGDTDQLLTVLAPGVIRTADAQSVPPGRPQLLRGAEKISDETRELRNAAKQAHIASINNRPGLVIVEDGLPRIALRFAVFDGRIVRYDVIADPDRLALLRVRW